MLDHTNMLTLYFLDRRAMHPVEGPLGVVTINLIWRVGSAGVGSIHVALCGAHLPEERRILRASVAVFS